MTTPTHIREDVIDATEGGGIGSYSQPIGETIFEDDHSAGALYRFGIREYGRCIGKAYVDTDDGVKHVGYVFQARRKYEDCAETYLHETWLTLEHIEPAQSTSVAL